MDEFSFSKQDSAELYRKWYLIKRKGLDNPYDKEQVDDLFNVIKSQVQFLIDKISNEKTYAFIVEIPFLFIDKNKYRQYDVEVAVLGNTLECINIPGCMAEGDNRHDAFDNLIRAVIQCSDARLKNGFWYLNRVFPMRLYYPNMVPISSDDLIENLITDGWNIKYPGPYHTVLLREASKVTFTVQNKSIISETLHFAYIHLQLLLNSN